jgi:hypothetical protein
MPGGITGLYCILYKYRKVAFQIGGVSIIETIKCSSVPWDSGLRPPVLAMPSKN